MKRIIHALLVSSLTLLTSLCFASPNASSIKYLTPDGVKAGKTFPLTLVDADHHLFTGVAYKLHCNIATDPTIIQKDPVFMHFIYSGSFRNVEIFINGKSVDYFKGYKLDQELNSYDAYFILNSEGGSLVFENLDHDHDVKMSDCIATVYEDPSLSSKK